MISPQNWYQVTQPCAYFAGCTVLPLDAVWYWFDILLIKWIRFLGCFFFRMERTNSLWYLLQHGPFQHNPRHCYTICRMLSYWTMWSMAWCKTTDYVANTLDLQICSLVLGHRHGLIILCMIKSRFSTFYLISRFLSFQPYTRSMPVPGMSQSSPSSHSSAQGGSTCGPEPGEKLSRTNLYIRGLTPNTTDRDLVNLCQQWVKLPYSFL